MTAADFDEYVQQDPGSPNSLAALAGKLQPSVDGDLLINTVETVSAKEVVAALQPYISGEVGLIGKLVIKINNFLASEEAARQKDKKGKKKELDEAKALRLQDSMMKEQEGMVSSSTMQQLFQAHKAQAIADLPVRRAAARAEYEKNGLVFKMTVPGTEHLVTQVHYAFYLQNKKSLLQDLGFKLESSQRVAGGKTEDRIRVPGSWLKVLFMEREASKEDLRLDGAHAGRPDLRTGPFGCTQFMSLIAQKRKDTYAHAPRTMCTTSNGVAPHPAAAVATPLPPCHPVRVCRVKEVKRLVSKKTVEQLQALEVLEVSAATAKGLLDRDEAILGTASLVRCGELADDLLLDLFLRGAFDLLRRILRHVHRQVERLAHHGLTGGTVDLLDTVPATAPRLLRDHADVVDAMQHGEEHGAEPCCRVPSRAAVCCGV